jgi:hypothetical protein
MRERVKAGMARARVSGTKTGAAIGRPAVAGRTMRSRALATASGKSRVYSASAKARAIGCALISLDRAATVSAVLARPGRATPSEFPSSRLPEVPAQNTAALPRSFIDPAPVSAASLNCGPPRGAAGANFFSGV